MDTPKTKSLALIFSQRDTSPDMTNGQNPQESSEGAFHALRSKPAKLLKIFSIIGIGLLVIGMILKVSEN